jgi:hypothetical protein
MSERCGYSPKRMEEIFLHGPVVDNFLCSRKFIERMYQKYGKEKVKTFVARQPFERDADIDFVIGLILN